NALGPLLNPARPSRQLIGVFDPRLTGIFAEVLRELRHERAWIVHGLGDNEAGIDDISVSGPTTVADLADDKITSAILDVSWLCKIIARKRRRKSDPDFAAARLRIDDDRFLDPAPSLKKSRVGGALPKNLLVGG